jgi:acetolactate synthase small subunit
MKLAEALQERADLKRTLNNLKERLQRVTLVQEGEKPAEDPQELLRIQDACFERMEYLIAAINHSNDVIQVNGMTLTQLIAKKDVLLMKLAAYKNVIRDAGSNTNRARGTEIRILSTVKAAELQAEADRMSKEIRTLDNLLQETNWTRDLIE